MKISDIGKDPTTLIYLQSMGFRTCNAIGRVTSGKPTQEPLCQTISGTMLKKNRCPNHKGCTEHCNTKWDPMEWL